jgi:hypothetical protein
MKQQTKSIMNASESKSDIVEDDLSNEVKIFEEKSKIRLKDVRPFAFGGFSKIFIGIYENKRYAIKFVSF